MLTAGKIIKSHGYGRQYGIWGIYEGMFIQGKAYGYGKILYPNGNLYEGYFDNGIFSGSGQFKYPNGTVLSGNWKNGILTTSITGIKFGGTYEEIITSRPIIEREIPISIKDLSLNETLMIGFEAK